MDDQRTERIEVAAEADLHELWQQREGEYARQRTKLAVIVGCTIFGVFLVWTISMGDTVRSFATGTAGTQYEKTFLKTIQQSEQRLAAYSPPPSSTPVATSTPAAAATSSSFLNALKDKAQNFLTPSSTTH